MADEKPQSRPEPPRPGPSVYGGQWGQGGKPDSDQKGEADRPRPISTPRESSGTPDAETSPPTDE